jgi:two-component system, response regulator
MPGTKRNDNKGPRIVVVEDNADDRELLLRQLRKAGLANHMKFITDGREALDFLTGPNAEEMSQNLIAIFLDLKLSGMGGIELLRRLRAHEAYAETPLIVMTSSNDPLDMEECQRLNVAHFVTKPVSLTAFAKAIADTFHPPLRQRTSSLAMASE